MSAAAASSAWARSRRDRAACSCQLANLPTPPGIRADQHAGAGRGHALFGTDELDPLEFVRTIAVARILMPRSYVRLSAGRTEMSDETQALCFLAGANSIFYGERLLTTDNPEADQDRRLFERLGLNMEQKIETERPPEGRGCHREAV